MQNIISEVQAVLAIYPTWMQLIIVVATLSMIPLLIGIVVKKMRKSKVRSSNLIKTSKGKNKLFFVYYIFSHTPVLKEYFEKIKRKVEEQYPADIMSINNKTTLYMLKAIIKMVAVLGFTLVVAKGDLYTICVGILISIIIGINDVNSKLRKFEIVLLEQLWEAVSSIRHYYGEGKTEVPDAIDRVLEDVDYEVGLHLQKIYKITESVFIEQEIDEYVETSPNKFFLLLTSICATIQKYGDPKVDNTTAFQEGLKQTKKDIGIEIQKRKNIEYSFMGLTTFALFPILFLKPIEAWASTSMPELVKTYQGTYGVVILVLIMLSEIICYALINVYMTSEKTKIKTSSIWQKLASISAISKLLNAYINKNYTKTLRLNKKLRAIGDHTGPAAFLLKRIMVAVCFFFLVVIVTQTSIVKERINSIASFKDTFNEAIVPSRAYLNTMEETAVHVAEMNSKFGTKVSEEKLLKEVMENSNIKSPTHAQTVVNAVMERLEERNKLYYKWYYLFLALGGGILGFWLPRKYVEFKLKTVSLNMQDETMQFQSLALILMNIKGMSAEQVIDWMERFSYCFKTSLLKCQMEIKQDEDLALNQLREAAQEDYTPFAQFVDNLKKIDSVGVEKAFDEIKVDREYLQETRKEENKRLTSLKARKAARIAFIPAVEVIILYIMGPMIVMAIKMQESMMSML